MQFTTDGPDVPERLLQAHEDGRVVFFCGAGISYPAGLPGFKGLVERLYTARNVVPDPVQAAAIRSGRYDTAIGLLEARDIGGRATVREALVDILTPNLTAPRATDTHQALLTLGTTRDGHTRLVTTNFDRIFETVLSRTDAAVNRYRAPLLPIPKSRWDGLVYLHGLLTEDPSPSDLTSVVVSSGDFWSRVPHGAMGFPIRQRTFSQLHRLLRGLQPRRPRSPLHDRRSIGRPPTG